MPATAMKRDEVLSLIRAHRGELEQFGVKSLAVFGSVARDEAKPESDLDVLADFGPEPTFKGFMGLKFYLEDLLGIRVDLATPDMLHPMIRDSVLREALRVS
jgi:uncharacterized protein